MGPLRDDDGASRFDPVGTDAPRLLSILCWDGALPLVGIAAGVLLALLCELDDDAALYVIVLVPVALALVRCEVGWRQLRSLHAGKSFFRKEILLAGLIVLLMVFEMFVILLSLGSDVPLGLWLIALAWYALYVAFAAYVFRGARSPARDDPA